MKTTLYTKIDKETKERAQNLAGELGIPLSTVINSQLREFVRSGTFSVSREPQIKDKVMDELMKISKEAKSKKNIVTFESNDEMDEYLMSL